MAAIQAFDFRTVIDLIVEGETVTAALGAVEIDTHCQECTRFQRKW